MKVADLVSVYQTHSDAMNEIDQLRKVLDELVHAIEDDVDDYPRMEEACKKAKLFLPDYLEI